MVYNHPDMSIEGIENAEHIDPGTTGDNIAAKKSANYVWDGVSAWTRMTQPGAGGGGAATIADGADVAEGATTDAVVAAGATGTVSAKLRRLTTDLSTVVTNTTNAATTTLQTTGNTSVASIDTKTPTVGQKAMAASSPVVIASDQSAIPTKFSDVVPATQNITTQDVGSTSTTGANSQAIITGSATANSTASFALSSVESIKIQVSGSWTGTLQSEISLDSGTTWYINGIHQSGTAYTVATFTNNFGGGLNVSGVTNFRLRATAAITGTAVVLIAQTSNANSVYVANGLNLQDAVTQSQKLVVDSTGALSANITRLGSTTAAVSPDGNLYNKDVELRRVNELQFLQLQASQYSQVMSADTYGGSRYGFELR